MNTNPASSYPEKDDMKSSGEPARAWDSVSDSSEKTVSSGSPDSSEETRPAVSYTDVKDIDWEAALRANEHWLRTIIAARVGEKAAVEEVFQEVSLAAIRQKAPLQDPSKISPWLYRLAVTQSLLYRRSMGRKRKLIDRYTEKVPIGEFDQSQKDPLSWLLAEERRSGVRKAMSELPKNQQELLLLKYVHEWSYKEMADKIGTTVSAIQARLHRARALLREKLLKMGLDQ
ncbi:MAG: sigma-70 family RNA polymerase sigma factor [Planctomycetia bacterium]|nr:sigma-70 family RNA polymerase sigma factor [Planctomycetia bacterium]